MLEGIEEKPLASLYLNANNTLIRRLMHIQDEALLRQTIKILYVQSLLAGGHSVQGEELRALNGGLMMLLERISYEEWEQENED